MPDVRNGALDRRSLKMDMNRWPELRALTAGQLCLWKLLHDRSPEWIPAPELCEALGVSLRSLQLMVCHTRKPLRGLQLIVARRSNSRRYKSSSSAFRPVAYALRVLGEMYCPVAPGSQCPTCGLDGLTLRRAEEDTANVPILKRHPNCGHVMAYDSRTATAWQSSPPPKEVTRARH
jgi:hypothetical protein